VLLVRGCLAERQALKLCLRGEGSVEVVEGLAEGETVVPAGAAIKAGQRVRRPPDA